MVVIMKDYSQADKAATKEFGTGEGRPIQKIAVTQPDAFPGDEVWFDNPRTKNSPSEFGVVVDVRTHWLAAHEYRHFYEVKPYSKSYTVKVESLEKIFKEQRCECGKVEIKEYSPCCSLHCWNMKFN
jgi:hypothetical protein